MLFVAGLVLLVLGLVCGAFLVLFALNVAAGVPGGALWVLFPVLTIVGYLMSAASARNTTLPLLARASGALLVLLGLAAGVALVLQETAIIASRGDPGPLWFVLVVGLVLGAAGLASHRGAPADRSAA